MQIVIVAGGGGSRLWPMSTPDKPKQFIPIINQTSSLEMVYGYISSAFTPDSIWINTNSRYKQLVSDILPDFDISHILTEPEKRDNFAAVAVQAARIAHEYGADEPIVFTTSDEFFGSDTSSSKFTNALRSIGNELKTGSYDIITMGVKATNPNVNYGYVELNPTNKTRVFDEVVPVLQFKEKPSESTARQYLDSGNFVWNKFNPSFTYATLKKVIDTHHPGLAELFNTIYTTGHCSDEMYAQIPKISFDYAVMEKVDSMGIIALDIEDWIDVGNWQVAFQYLPEPEDNVLQIEAKNNKLLTTNNDLIKKIGFVGVEGLLVVESEGRLLIVDPTKAAKVKEVTDYFE